MGAGASLHNNNNNNHHLLENVKNMDAKELSKFARKNKINTFVRETIKLNDIDGKTAIELDDDIIQDDKNGKHFKRQAADTDRFKKKKLDDDAAKALAVILGINGSVPPPPGVPSGIEILYLNENRVGDEGAIAIGKALLRNKESNLKKIYMYNNLMTMKGEQFLRKVADRKKGLTIHGINVAKQRDSYSVMKSNFIGKGEKNYGVYMSMGTM